MILFAIKYPFNSASCSQICDLQTMFFRQILYGHTSKNYFPLYNRISYSLIFLHIVYKYFNYNQFLTSRMWHPKTFSLSHVLILSGKCSMSGSTVCALHQNLMCQLLTESQIL